MPDQRSMQCEATHDHEPHTWLTDEKKWCPGVIAPTMQVWAPRIIDVGDDHGADAVQQIEESEEARPAPDWIRCRNYSQGAQCVLVKDHGGKVHKDYMHREWPMHLPFKEKPHCDTCTCMEPKQATCQCRRTTAHSGHVWSTEFSTVWCDGIKAHPKTQIGR